MAQPSAQPSIAVFVCSTQWPHVVLAAHNLINGAREDPTTNLRGCFLFACLYSSAAYLILDRPRVAITIGAVGMFAVPYFGAFDGLSKACYSLATLCHLIRLRQITIDRASFQTSGWLYRYMFLSWVGSDLRTARKVAESARSSLVAQSVQEKLVSLLLCVACHLTLEQKIPFTVFGDLAAGWPCTLMRWTVAGVFFYNSLHMLDVVYRLPVLWVEGIAVVACHDSPIQAKSLSEFWGKRWDKAVQMMLRDTVFTPLRTAYGLTVAVWVTFAASGILHVWALLWAGMPTTLCGYMMLFFVLQPVLLELERRLTLRSGWRLILAVTAPLFLEPFLSMLGW
jgi:hypothetical protein